jgi:hypothetical protein
LNQGARVGTEIAKVDRLTTLFEQEHPIENLEQLSRRLMDPEWNETVNAGETEEIEKGNVRAKNRLSLVSQTSKERNDSPGTLRVKTRCRLVQKQQKFGLIAYHETLSIEESRVLYLRSQLNSDGRPLAILDVQGTNNSIRIFVKAAHLDALLDTRSQVRKREENKTNVATH